MKRITLFENGTLVQKSDRLEIYLNDGGIIERAEGCFYWFYGDSIPFSPSYMETIPYTEGYASSLSEAMRNLVIAAMS